MKSYTFADVLCAIAFADAVRFGLATRESLLDFNWCELASELEQQRRVESAWEYAHV